MVYQGYRVPVGGGCIDIVKAQDLDARQLWSSYVAQRKPVLIQGHLTDAGWKATAKWDNHYLSKVAVEKRDGPGGSYGQGRKQHMLFRQFLDRMNAGDDTLYLTTQEVAMGVDAHPELVGHPLLALQSDFEAQPSLAGHLVPQQVNLWMGLAADGASSGLHHDFHDNLYVLMRGRKRFRLFDPSRAHDMYTYGKIRLVHPNGRIVYEGQGDVLADGSAADDVKLWRERAAAEQAVAAAELAVQLKQRGSAEQLRRAEAQLEAVLDRELDQAMEQGGSDDGDDEEDEEPAQGGGGGRRRAPPAGETRDPEHPPSFSKVDLAAPDASLRRRFPRFPGAAAAMEVVVEAGCMLYLPCGWFHEVTSFSGAAAGGGAGGGGSDEPGHLALNYWFHPPDNLDASYEGFTAPYTCDFLPSLWRERAAAADRGEEDGGGGAGPDEGAGCAGQGQAPPHRAFEGVHVDEHEGGTGHSLQIQQLMQMLEPGGRQQGGEAEAGGGGRGKRGGSDGALVPAAEVRGQAKRRRRASVGGAGGAAEAGPDDDRENVAVAVSEVEKQRLHDEIKAMLMQGLLVRAGGAGAHGASPRVREFQPILGRRHHAVMYVPPRSGKAAGRQQQHGS